MCLECAHLGQPMIGSTHSRRKKKVSFSNLRQKNPHLEKTTKATTILIDEVCNWINNNFSYERISLVFLLICTTITLQFVWGRNEELLEILKKPHLQGKDMRVIRNLDWEQTVCMRIENVSIEYTRIWRSTTKNSRFSNWIYKTCTTKCFQEEQNSDPDLLSFRIILTAYNTHMILRWRPTQKESWENFEVW